MKFYENGEVIILIHRICKGRKVYGVTLVKAGMKNISMLDR